MRTILLFVFIVILAIIPFLSSGQDNSLPACSESELQVLDIITSEYINLTNQSVDSIDSLLVYADSHLSWRETTLSQLPDCAIEAGMLMSQIISDSATHYAMQLAGVSDADNPYIASINDNADKLAELITSLEATDTTQATLTYYVIANGSVNIRSCGATTCAVVATARRGESLTVVDNSSDWYELQLDDGSTGYIADFLVSVNPPSVQPASVPAQPTAVPVQPTLIPEPISTAVPPPPSDAQICGGATTCGAMGSCDQAYACLRAGNGRLDRDNDGVPCESICPGG